MAEVEKQQTFFKDAVLLLLPEQCYNEYFVKFNFFDVPCLKTSISKALGLGIIAGSLTVKFPQIFKIHNARSAAGVSFLSVLADLFAVTAVTTYSYVKGFPFSTWGEGLFLTLQTLAICALVLRYNMSAALAGAFSMAYGAVFYALASGLTPIETLWTLQSISVPVMFVGKLLQAFTNYRNGGTGQLSAVTCWLLLAGSIARIFTSVQETGDTLIIVTYLLATVGNLVLVAQLVYYSRKQATIAKKKDSAKKKQ